LPLSFPAFPRRRRATRAGPRTRTATVRSSTFRPTQAEGAPPVGSGRRFRTADGRAEVSIYTLPNAEHATPRTYLSRHLKSDFSNLHYDRVGDRFFAVSGIVRGKTFYSRCNFDGRRGAMHCLYLDYPAAQTHAWDALVTRMSLSLRADRSRGSR
jgi:hypothetical protein